MSPLAQNAKFIRRGGIYPARGALRRRKPGRYGIGPYGGGVRVARGLRRFCLPCQREVARPKAVTEGLPYGGLTLLSSGILRRGNPPVRGLRRGQPPLTRGPVGSVRRDEASRPTVARAVAVVPVGPKRNILFVGAGFIPPAGPRAAANRADMESAPTGGAVGRRVCGGFASLVKGRWHGRRP